MNAEDAKLVVGEYRQLVKSWTMVVAGMQDGDPVALNEAMTALEHGLAEAAVAYPPLAYEIDILVNARKRVYVPMEERAGVQPTRFHHR
jgi:hypothetical protein